MRDFKNYMKASFITLSLITVSFIIVIQALPLFSIFNNVESENYNNYKNIKGDNFIILNNNYTVNATVVKQSIKYNIKSNYITGEIIFVYNNIFDNHYYCRISIDMPEQIKDNIIRNYIYYNYNLGKEINLFCNNEECVEKKYNHKYDLYKIFTCHILNKYKINDEF